MLDAIMSMIGSNPEMAKAAMQTQAQAQAGVGANGLTQSGMTSNPLPSNPAEVDYAMQMQEYSADEMLPESNSFDYKGMLQSLGKAGQEMQKQQAQQPAPKIPQAQAFRPQGGGSAPVMLPTGMGGAQSGAMQAIQGGGMGNVIGGQPSREQLLRMFSGM